jgi:hypothetical protein
MRAGLIVNPRSGGASGKGLALARKLANDPHVTVRVIDAFHRLPDLLDDCARDGVTDLFISSGDGTVHAIQTELAERKPFATLPRLSLMPHGTTNMTAADLGFRRHNIDAQADFIRTLQPTDIQDRPTLRAANPRDGRARHGMFLGAGAVSEATLFCQRAFNARGVRGSWATFATLASTVARTLLMPANPHDTTRPDRPYKLEVTADGRTMCSGEQLLMLATTLEKLILGTRPFWGGHTAPIRATVLSYPPFAVLRWLLPTMYGSETRRMPADAMSFCGTTLTVMAASIYVMDGEFFDGPLDEPLRIETGPTFSYVRG